MTKIPNSSEMIQIVMKCTFQCPHNSFLGDYPNEQGVNPSHTYANTYLYLSFLENSLHGILLRGFSEHRRLTKCIGDFAQRSLLLFSPKEEATSAYDVVNKLLIIKSE